MANLELSPELPVRSGVLRRDGRGCYLGSLGLPHEPQRIEPIVHVLCSVLENSRQERFCLINSFRRCLIGQEQLDSLDAATQWRVTARHNFKQGDDRSGHRSFQVPRSKGASPFSYLFITGRSHFLRRCPRDIPKLGLGIALTGSPSWLIDYPALS